MNRTIAAATTLGVIGGLSGAIRAQCSEYFYELIAAEGDVVPGVGAITGFGKLKIRGNMLIEAETDHPDPGARRVVLGHGGVLLRQGQALPEPAGATVRAFDDFSLGKDQRTAWLLSLNGTAGSHDDAAIYFGERLVLQKGAPAEAGFPADFRYLEFFGIELEGDERTLFMTTVGDPALPGPHERALMLIPPFGWRAPEIVYKKGDILPGQTEPVEDLQTGRGQFGISRGGRIMTIVDLAGSADVDGAVYLDGELLVQEGDESPVPGRRWRSFDDARLGVADISAGLQAQIDGDPASDAILVHWLDDWTSGRTVSVVAQKGRPVPGLPHETLAELGDAIVVGNGDVIWHGRWTGGEAIFVGRDPVIVAGETEIDGHRVTGVAAGPHILATGSEGGAVLAQVVLDGGRAAVVLVGRFTGCWCYADFDCNGVLDFFDFLEFQTAFALQTPHADCDGSGSHDLFDFLCFQDSFHGGCCP